MPSKSKDQAKFMAAVAHNASFAKKAGVPQSVGKEFNEADKGRKFKQGGSMKESKAMVAKEMAFMKKKGAPKSMIKHEMAEAGMKKGYADGGMTMVNKGGKMVPDFAADGKGKMAKGGMANGKMPAALAKHANMPASKAHKGLKAGGSVGTTKMGSVKTATKPDGVISKGGTKGTMVKMARGGKTC